LVERERGATIAGGGVERAFGTLLGVIRRRGTDDPNEAEIGGGGVDGVSARGNAPPGKPEGGAGGGGMEPEPRVAEIGGGGGRAEPRFEPTEPYEGGAGVEPRKDDRGAVGGGGGVVAGRVSPGKRCGLSSLVFATSPGVFGSGLGGSSENDRREGPRPDAGGGVPPGGTFAVVTRSYVPNFSQGVRPVDPRKILAFK